MNLNDIAAGAVSSINAFTPAVVRTSAGYTTNPDGRRVPTYNPDVTVKAQVQALSYKDLTQTDGLDLNGTKRAIYLNGRLDGVVRSLQKGGDLIIISSGINAGVWLVAMVLEQWDGWVKVAATLQNESPT